MSVEEIHTAVEQTEPEEKTSRLDMVQVKKMLVATPQKNITFRYAETQMQRLASPNVNAQSISRTVQRRKNLRSQTPR